MLRVVISDASPLQYLILIGNAEVLQALYTEVLIPEAVAKELQQPATPESVQRLDRSRTSMASHCSTAPPTPVLIADLDAGEHDAHSFSTACESRSGYHG